MSFCGGNGSRNKAGRRMDMALASSRFEIRASPVRRRGVRGFEDASAAEVAKLSEGNIERAFMEIDALSEEVLRNMAGEDDFGNVDLLEIRVDTRDQSISQLGLTLPNLLELRMSHSIFHSFRDFGIHLKKLRRLQISSSDVRDLDGVGALVNLEELVACNNQIRDLAPLALHENLRLLDLRNNLVSELAEVDQLGTCPLLRELFLEGNPISEVNLYRRIVSGFLPFLETLDNVETTEDDKRPVADNMLENISSTLTLEEITRNLATKDMLSKQQEQQNHSSGDTCSDLTHGENSVVFSGNLANSIRRRKKQTQNEEFRFRTISAQFVKENPELQDALVPEASVSHGNENNNNHLELELEALLQRSNSLEREFATLKRSMDQESPKSRIFRSKGRFVSTNRKERLPVPPPPK